MLYLNRLNSLDKFPCLLYLTLTSVVFELLRLDLFAAICTNLTLTSVVFESKSNVTFNYIFSI